MVVGSLTHSLSTQAACLPASTAEHKSEQPPSLGLLAFRKLKLPPKKISYIEKPSFQFGAIPDIGVDCFMTSNGTPLGTGGVGPCFVVCMIGETARKSPVLGLCHKSSLSPMDVVLHLLKHAMVAQQQAVEDTIRTYIVGGESPSKESSKGTLEEEKEILIRGKQEKIVDVLFNQLQPEKEEYLDVVLTPQTVYVSKEELFHVTGREDGIELSEYESGLYTS